MTFDWCRSYQDGATPGEAPVGMNAVQFHRDNLEIREVAVPEPASGEALVRVHLAGICNTDLEILQGYGGFSGTLGHEFVGRVERVRDADPRWTGQRVVGEINLGCYDADCSWCHGGLDRHCPKRKCSAWIDPLRDHPRFQALLEKYRDDVEHEGS